jgi:hypothetical protein
VDWEEKTKTVTGAKDGVSVSLAIGENAATVNGARTPLDVPARIVSGRTLVPIRFVAESLSAAVEWDASRRVVAIRE